MAIHAHGGSINPLNRDIDVTRETLDDCTVTDMLRIHKTSITEETVHFEDLKHITTPQN